MRLRKGRECTELKEQKDVPGDASLNEQMVVEGFTTSSRLRNCDVHFGSSLE